MTIKNIVILVLLGVAFMVGCSFVRVMLVRDGGGQLHAVEKIAFWDVPRKGANIFNKKIIREDIRAAKTYGIEFIRLAPDKFLSAHRDFLIGDASQYMGLVPEDLAVLKEVLSICSAEHMPVVLSMLSLPGSRWKQNNNGKDDLRLWADVVFKQQAIRFWRDLAAALKGYSVIVGYNILNEPHPERLYDVLSIHIDRVKQTEVQGMLAGFYRDVIAAIRVSDKETPIVLDSSAYGDPNTFKDFIPYPDGGVLYSFHMYEPYEYTNAKINGERFSYPGMVEGIYWDKTTLRRYMQNVGEFQRVNKIASNRILVGEFGGERVVAGLARYFGDLIEIFKENRWHFAFYAFREDVWPGMDYELGTAAVPGSYWLALENGQIPTLSRSGDVEPFKTLKDGLR